MSEYINIKGQQIKILSSDPSNPTLGQLWYNTTVKELRTRAFFEGWASGANMGQGKYNGGAAGIQTAALAYGGNQPGVAPNGSPPGNVKTEEYDGSSWTAGGNMSPQKSLMGSFGTQTAAMAAGGTNPPITNTTQEYDGTSWTAGPNLGTGRYRLQGATGILTAGIVFGGRIGPPNFAISDATEEYDGSSWTAGGALSNGRQQLGAAGTQTAALGFGGDDTVSPTLALTEEYNGTSWTAGGNLGTARYGPGGSGIQTAALAFGGSPYAITDNTESYNGTSWSASKNLLSSKRSLMGTGAQDAGMAIGGTPAPQVLTQEFDISTGTRNFPYVPTGQ